MYMEINEGNPRTQDFQHVYVLVFDKNILTLLQGAGQFNGSLAPCSGLVRLKPPTLPGWIIMIAGAVDGSRILIPYLGYLHCAGGN